MEPYKFSLPHNEINKLPPEVDLKKNDHIDFPKDFLGKEKNESSIKTLMEIELPENEKEKIHSNNLIKNEIHTKVSSYSLSSVELKKTVTHSNKKKESKNILPEAKFEFKDLEKTLREYIEQLKKRGKQNIISILNMNPVKLDDNNDIIFTVANEMNRVEINIEKEKLLPFLHKKLNNFKIKIKVIVDELAKDEVIFSPKEKYQHLLKINPSLEILRKTFDLEY